MDNFIGIDGGGSGSRLVAIDKNRSIIAQAEGGPTNLTALPYDTVRDNIKNLLAKSQMSGADCKYIYMGCAGASTHDNTIRLHNILKETGYHGPATIINDAHLALLAATQGKPGIILIAGTGSIAYGMDIHGRLHRAGGWGHLIDDGGSGYRISMDAIKAALMDFDKRGPSTILTQVITQYFGVSSPDEILLHIYGHYFDKSHIAGVSILVHGAAAAGDAVAIKILDQAVTDLVALASKIFPRIGADRTSLVLSGGIILNSSYIHGAFREIIGREHPYLEIIDLPQSVAHAAAELALRSSL